MNTGPRKLRHFGAPLLIMLLAASLGWFVQAIGVVAVVFIVVLVKRFGRFEAQLAASTFTVVSALLAPAPHSQFKVDRGFLETALCVACVWVVIVIANNRDSAEKVIRRSKRELREVMDTIPAMVWIALPDGSNLSMNRRWTEYAGLSPTGLGWQAAVHPDDLERHIEAFRKCSAAGVPFEDEVRFRRSDGEFRWFVVAAEPFRDEHGRIVKWYGIGTDIEDRKRVEQELRAAEHEARELLERVPAMISLRTATGITYTNQPIHNYIGVEHQELQGGGWQKYLHPEDQERALANQARSTEEMETMDHLYRLRGADGVYRWFRTIAEPYPSVDGKSCCWYGVTTDIDELYSSRELLRERELQLSLFTENLPAVLFKAAPDGSIVYINQKGIEYGGRTLEDLQQKGWIDLIHPDDIEETTKHWNRMLTEGLGYDTVHRFMGADGQYRWFHTSVAACLDDTGKTIAFHGIMLDTSAQKAAEYAVQQSEHQMQRMMDTVPSSLYSTAPDGKYTFVNKKARDYLGMTLDQIKGWGWVEATHSEEQEYVVKEFKKALGTGSSYSNEHRIRRADGIYHWHLSRAEPLRDEDGQIVQWFGVAIDIDERKRAEDHLRETRVKLARASRIATVAELSASIAHELNQPLTAVIANAQAARRWLLNSPTNFSEAMTSIERVLRDGRVADERMQHIRALFKQQPLRKKHAWPSQIIREAIRFVHEDPKRDEILIDVQIAGHLPPILVEQIQIQEVLINLISNGIEAMESNARTPHLMIRAAFVNESELLIEVIDNGPGLKDTQSIFDAFATTKEKGMGIGLAISRSIIEAHDGQLWAENNPDYGAKFSVKLPCGARSVPHRHLNAEISLAQR
ncbi:PAS domain-containing protein [Tunturiibacter lichenicola]|uniref:PAS domain-containing protein n=1 Tax=Tunturiibacter lichenicola TaxID=2051959 RepID=UPI003D9ACC9B